MRPLLGNSSSPALHAARRLLYPPERLTVRPLATRLPFNYRRLPERLRLAVFQALSLGRGIPLTTEVADLPFERLWRSSSPAERALIHEEMAPLELEERRVLLTHDVETFRDAETISEVARIEEACGFRSVWNLIGLLEPWDVGLLERLRNAGHELGLHGFFHDTGLHLRPRAEVEALFQRVAPQLRRWGIAGGRLPFWLVDRELLAACAGFLDYDTSLLDEPLREGDAPGGCGSVRPYRIGRLVEIPTNLVFEKPWLFPQVRADPVELFTNKAEEISALGGLPSCLTHPTRGYLHGLARLGAYRQFLEELAGRGFTGILPQEVVRMTRAEVDGPPPALAGPGGAHEPRLAATVSLRGRAVSEARPVLVTGASGFVGVHLIRGLLAAGVPCRALVRSTSSLEPLLAVGVELHEGDVTRPSSLDAAFAGCKAVVHLAGAADVADPAVNARVNVDGTVNVAAACQRAGVARLVFFSTNCAARQLQDAYGRTKREAEHALAGLDLDVRIFRPTMIYGEGSREFTTFVHAVARSPLVPIPGRGEHVLRPVFVDDVVALTLAALERDGLAGRTWDVVGPDALTLNQLIALVAGLLGKRRRPVRIPLRACLWAAKLLGAVSAHPLVTPDQVLAFAQDTTGDLAPTIRDLGRSPVGMEPGLRLLLGRTPWQRLGGLPGTPLGTRP